MPTHPLNHWRLTRHTIVAITACVAVGASAMSQDSRPGHEQRLPGRIISSLTFHDATASAQRCRESHARQFGSLCDRFLAGIDSRRPEISARLQKDIGINQDEFCELGLGQITVASVKVSDQPLAMIALLDFEKRSLMDRIVARLNQAVIDANFQRSDLTVGETRIAVFQRDSPQREFAVCIHDNTLCLATRSGVLAAMLQVWNSPASDTLSVPAYAAVREHCHVDGRLPVLTWFVDPISLLTEVTLAEESRESEFRQFFLSLIPQLGLDKLHGIGGTFDVGGDDYASIVRVQFVMDGPPSGLLSILHLQSDELRPPAWMLQETSSYLAFHWDLDRFFAGSGEVLAILAGENALQDYLNKISLLRGGLDLKRDVADRLTGRVTMTQPMIDGQARWMVALQVRDPQQIAELMRDSNSNPTSVGGNRTDPAETSVKICRRHAFGMDVCVALVEDSLLISDCEPAIQQTIAAASKPKHIQVSLERAVTCLPEKCLMQALNSTDPTLSAVYEYLRTETTPEKTLGVDFSLLPEFDQVKRRIGPSAACAVQNSAGILFTHRSLLPGGGDPTAAR
ncbi:MAG: hypothetical protein R3C59_07010 [Planctomycetaceae bacterium]